MYTYKYLNVNPVGIEEEDCVTRAIKLATGRSYFEIRKKLQLTAELLDCEELCVCCYNHLLDCVFKFPREEIKSGQTVAEFAKQHQRGVYLVRIDGHLTCIINGCIYDLWNCGNRKATHAWRCD